MGLPLLQHRNFVALCSREGSCNVRLSRSVCLGGHELLRARAGHTRGTWTMMQGLLVKVQGAVLSKALEGAGPAGRGTQVWGTQLPHPPVTERRGWHTPQPRLLRTLPCAGGADAEGAGL